MCGVRGGGDLVQTSNGPHIQKRFVLRRSEDLMFKLVLVRGGASLNEVQLDLANAVTYM